MNYNGIIIGIGAFLIIGIMHPVVIKTEYYVGTWVWPLFLAIGVVCAGGSLFLQNPVVSSLVSVLGFSFLWSIHELKEQEQRVAKGWFPANPKKKN